MPLNELIDTFYESIPNFRIGNPSDLKTGDLAFVPTPDVRAVPLVMDTERASRTSHTNIEFNLRDMLAGKDFKTKDKLPIKGLDIDQTEEVLCTKGKNRLCILLSKSEPRAFSGGGFRSRKHWTRTHGHFVPLFSIKGEGERNELPVLFVQRVKTLMYRQFFHCPESSITANPTDFYVKDSIARIDLTFPAVLLVPGVTPVNVRLSSEACRLFQSVVSDFLGLLESTTEIETLNAFRELLTDALTESK